MEPTTTETNVAALLKLAGELFRNDNARATSLYEEALALTTHPESPDPLGQAESLLGLSKVATARGQNERSLVQALEALALFRQLASFPGQIGTLRHLGTLYQVMGDYAASLDCHLEALGLARAHGDRAAQSTIALSIGNCYSGTGRPSEALPYYDQALAIARELGNLQLEGRILNSYCVDATNIGAYDQALAHGRRSAEIFAQTGDGYGQGVALGSIGEAHVAAGQYSEALDVFRRSLDFLRLRSPTLSSYEAIAIFYQMGLAHLNLGELERAEELFETTLARATEARTPSLAYQAHERLAELCELRGDLGQALAHYRRFHALREQVFNEESDRKLKNLEVLHQTQQALEEAERQKRLREDDRRYFEQLAQLQREFFNTATHDLKNPLSALELAIKLLEQIVGPATPEVHELLVLMKRGISRMHQLIADFLDLARLETGRALNVRPVVFADLLDGVLRDHQLAAGQKELGLSAQSQLEDGIVECDPGLIARALDNLVGNAIKYTPAGGRVSLVARQAGATVTITVADTGLGIPAADVPRLFEPFYRVRAASHAPFEGTGLGLTIVKAIVEQHGGSILVESTEGQGSRFHLSLPLSQAQNRAVERGGLPASR